MSIRMIIEELDQLKKEILRNNTRNRALRERKKVLENNIAMYLKNKNQKGVKYKGTSIMIEEIEKRKIKKKSLKERDSITFFENLGVSNPTETYKQLLEVQKGEFILKNKLKIKKLKKK